MKLDTIIEQLKQWLILSVNDLIKIKNYIATKYIAASQRERAEILSNTVHQVLDKHLDGVDQEYKKALKYNILSSTIGQSNYDISKYDVFKSIFDLDLPPSTQIELASNWIDQSTDLKLETGDILEFVIAYSQENDQTFMPRTLADNQHQHHYQATSTAKTHRKNPIWTFINTYFFNTEFAITFIILAIIGFTLGSAIVLSTPDVLESKPAIIIERSLSAYENPFVTDKVLLMKTLSVKKMEGQYLVTILYDYPESEKNLFYYKPFDFMALKSYLINIRGSYIGESPYLNRIVNIAKLNDIDPLLLLSIIGQEQSFIPNNNPNKDKIINNPYNVYYSWESYNTTLSDTTQIAINTIKNSLEKRNSQDTDAIEWLNTTYAEDQNWHKGVREIYAFLDDLCRR